MLLSILPLNNWIWVLKHRSCSRCILEHVLNDYGNQRIYYWMTSSSALLFILCCYLAWRNYFNATSNKFFDINFWYWAHAHLLNSTYWLSPEARIYNIYKVVLCIIITLPIFHILYDLQAGSDVNSYFTEYFFRTCA